MKQNKIKWNKINCNKIKWIVIKKSKKGCHVIKQSEIIIISTYEHAHYIHDLILKKIKNDKKVRI